jgi:hypothetical protein
VVALKNNDINPAHYISVHKRQRHSPKKNVSPLLGDTAAEYQAVELIQ